MDRIDGPEWHNKMWFDTPMGVDRERQKAAKHPDDLLDCPGVHLKSIEEVPPHGFPKEFGKLTSYGSEVVVVSKHGSKNHPCIWRGTPDQYRSMWMVD